MLETVLAGLALLAAILAFTVFWARPVRVKHFVHWPPEDTQ